MDAARRAVCQDDPFNPLITTTLQASGILVISHFFHLILKPLGQPGPVAQILAGLVLGPTLLSRIKQVRDFFIQSSSQDYYTVFSSIFCIFIMFLIGLETDIPYMRRNLRKASIIAQGGVIICTIFGIAATFFIIHLLEIKEQKFALANVIIIVLANAASPVVIRLAVELKFATADVGRLAICSCIISEMTCIMWFSIYLAFQSSKMFGKSILFFFLTVLLVVVNKYLAAWCNQRNNSQKYVTQTEFLVIILLLITSAWLIEEYGFNSTMFCYIVGLFFPREGKTTRTLLRKLPYAVHTFILPVYFGYIGFQFDISHLSDHRNIIVVFLMIILSFGGKIIGTLAACRHLNIPMSEGIILAFLLNMKGHVELLLGTSLPKDDDNSWWNHTMHNLVIMVVVINTIITGPITSYLMKQKEQYFAHKHTSVEFDEAQSELRILMCVYSARHISSKIGLIAAYSGSYKMPMSAYLMYLVELPKKRAKKNLMYHELNDGDQYSDEEDYGGNDVVEINNAVDMFTMDTKIMINQKKVVSSYATMYEDVCDEVEDLRAQIVLLTFHKHQRLDGKMETGKEGIRSTNQKVLRHAPCSVGIFVDRGQTGFQQPRPDGVQNVAALFFGGPDDREALACSKRISANPYVNLTLIRFRLPPSSKQQKEDHSGHHHPVDDTSRIINDEILMAISSHHIEYDVDNAYVDDFYNRYVASGKVGYVEKFVGSGQETVETLKAMEEMFSLFIVGKGARGSSPMTTGMSDWEECPELGTVGDLLASSELSINASVLVIQQHRHSTNDIRGD